MHRAIELSRYERPMGGRKECRTSLSEGFVVDEARKHVEGVGRLVMRSEMASFVDFEEGESREGASATGSVAADDPVFGRGSIEATLSRPLHMFNPVFAAQVVADEVFNARVDQNANAAFED